jgi:aminoglycoside phosphotransferase family enzyme/predicted kinase
MDGFRVEDLLVAAAFHHPISDLAVKETHVSWVVLTGPFAYKIKKPVHYEFIDASTLDRRRFLCEEELRLNRRFAPDLYAGVVAITREDGRLVVGGRGEPLEYAVKMRQFDPSQELAERLARGDVIAADMGSFAALLADCHLRAPVAPPDGAFGTFLQVRKPMLDNFSLLRRHLLAGPDRGPLERLAAWTNASLERLQPLIESRRQSGAVRECHGDLHARNIVRWQQQWLPFDCLEFDPELRWIDVMGDAAFLFMDLVSHRRRDLACEFLSRYLEESGDYAGLRLLPLYASYLALVRAKVDALGAETAGAAERRALENRLAGRLATAVGFMDAGRPAIVIMHGVTASGKSWLSERLVSAIHALRIRSDLERKRLEGVAPLARRVFGVGEGPYGAAPTRATYDRLLELAECALDGNCSVVVDATFLDATQRGRFRSLALSRDCPFLIASCTSDAATLAARLQTRARNALDPSEATQAVLERQLMTLQALTADERLDAVQVDTSRPGAAGDAVAAIKARLPALNCPKSSAGSS